MTRPWMTTTMSRVIAGHVEGELGAALIERAEQEAASTMPTGWLRPISATAMPTKPEPAVKSSSMRCCTPMNSLTPTKPASAPERHMATMVMRLQLDAGIERRRRGLWPMVRIS